MDVPKKDAVAEVPAGGPASEAVSPHSEVLAGIKAELPLAIGAIPFGLIYGALALGAGLPASAAQAMSSIVFAGSAQFISAQLLGQSTPAIVVILTAGMVNLRHALYSASLAPYLQHLPSRWKYVLAYLLTDEVFAVTVTHYQGAGRFPGLGGKHWYFLSAGLTEWLAWQASTAVGVFLGAAIPPGWSLDFTLALTFIGLVVLNVKDRAGVAAALCGGVGAVLAAGLPFRLGLVLASFVGIAAGLFMESRMDRERMSVRK